MAFDPVKEDYQRLILRFARTQVSDEDSIATLMKDFNWRFSNDRNSLPQTDEDRAFNLVAQAAEIVDYRLPFVEESQAQALIDQGKRLLNQAIQLDPNCFDAQRMLHASNSRLFDAYYQFLVEKLPQVEAACYQKAQESSQGLPAEQAELAQRLAINPYKRWLATLSSRALICGRNKDAIAYGEKLLELDAADAADARFTLALAYAKLEDEDALDNLMDQYRKLDPPRGADDPWILLARLAIHFKKRELVEAEHYLDLLIERYPEATFCCFVQKDLPEGEFSRLNVLPYSEDELIIAIAEATVLLQEGNDLIGRGVLGRWLADQVRARDPKTVELAEKELQMQANALFASADSFPGESGGSVPNGPAGPSFPGGPVGPGFPGGPAGPRPSGPHIDGPNNPYSGGDAK